MLVDLTSTASPPEVAWTLACLVTAAINAWALWDAWADVVAVEHYVRPRPRTEPTTSRDRGADLRLPLAARGAVRREAGRLLVMLAFTALGLFALTTPPTYRTDGTANPNATLLPLLAVCVAMVFAIEAILDRKDRIQMLRMTRARRQTLRDAEVPE